MTEHRFKLKKDGKTVGYMQISEEVDTLSTSDPMAVFIKKVNGEWRTYEFDSIRHYKVIFNSIHPFVTKDENGKDVFAGDKAYGKVWMEDLPVHRIVGEVIYYNCGYCIQTPTTYYHLNDLKDIELIEDIEDEG